MFVSADDHPLTYKRVNVLFLFDPVLVKRVIRFYDVTTLNLYLKLVGVTVEILYSS